MPLLLKINKDYYKEETNDDSVVKFVIKEGYYYVLNKNIKDCIDLRYEQIKRNPHCYERNGTIVENGDVVVDLGAAEGAFTLTSSKKALKVYSFEPHPIYAELLRRSFKEFSNVKVIEIAASNKKGKGFISENEFASTTSDTKSIKGTEIFIDTLDNLLYNETKVDYIKCDIEGEEINMLLGAEQIIKRDKPKIAICVYHDPSHPEKIKNLLKEWVPEYKIKIIRNCVLHAYL